MRVPGRPPTVCVRTCVRNTCLSLPRRTWCSMHMRCVPPPTLNRKLECCKAHTRRSDENPEPNEVPADREEHRGYARTACFRWRASGMAPCPASARSAPASGPPLCSRVLTNEAQVTWVATVQVINIGPRQNDGWKECTHVLNREAGDWMGMALLHDGNVVWAHHDPIRGRAGEVGHSLDSAVVLAHGF